MTYEEWRTQMSELITKIPDKNVFVLVYDENGNSEHAGYGCDACAAQLVLRMILNGEFTHNDKMKNKES